MKKSLFGFVALAGMLAATSCSNDDLTVGKEASVNFAVTLDQVAATRAIADGTTVNKVYYEVYDQAGTTLVYEGSATVSNLGATISNVPLTTGTTYQVAFWAQDESCEMYNTEDLRNVQINYENVKNNNESMDAFCTALTAFEVTADGMTESVTLTRPFAQVNVGVPTENSFGITASQVTVNKYYTDINILSGEVSGLQETPLTFAMANVPGADEVLTVDQTNYAYASTTYLLAAADVDKVDLEFAFEGSNNYTLNYPNTPIQRNYRTNILTDQKKDMVNFEITIDPNFTADNGTLNGQLQQTEDLVTVSDVTATPSGDNVNFSAKYTGEVTEATFVCTPNTLAGMRTRAEEGVVEVPATSFAEGTISASAPASQFTAASYTVSVKVNGAETATGSTTTLTGTGTTEPDQPDQPGSEPVTVTFDFATNSYGLTVYDSSNSNGYPANGTTIKSGEVELTINPGGQGSGCRFWSTGSAQQFRIMKSSDISLSVPGANITAITITGGKLQFNSDSSTAGTWSGSEETVTLTNTTSSTVSLTEMTVTYEMTK